MNTEGHDITEELFDIHNHLRFLRSDAEALGSYIDEIECRYMEKEPLVKAFLPEIERFGRLRQEVNLLHRRYVNAEDHPPFYGLVIGVKDILHVDGFPTQAGSKVPAAELTGPEAPIITKLKRNGALILGKTVTTEFAYFAPGPTRNPHNYEHTPGGSSSGSAAAVAAGLVPLALGSQTIGSIIRPASYCGVFGYKPTYGRLPTEGVIPLAPSVDTIGFFTKNAINVEYLGKYLIDDWDSQQYPTHKPALGIPVGPYLAKSKPEMVKHFDTVCNRLRTVGYSIREIPAMEDFDNIYRHHNNLVAYEAAKTHITWFKKYHNLYHPKTTDLIERGLGITENEYKKALDSRYNFRDALQALQIQSGIDLWLSPPALGAASRGLASTGDPIMNLPWTHCGFPTVNLPVGYNQVNLPMGLQVTGAHNMDEALFKWVEEISLVLKEPIQQ